MHNPTITFSCLTLIRFQTPKQLISSMSNSYYLRKWRIFKELKSLIIVIKNILMAINVYNIFFFKLMLIIDLHLKTLILKTLPNLRKMINILLEETQWILELRRTKASFISIPYMVSHLLNP